MPEPSTPTKPAFTPALVNAEDLDFGFKTFNEPGLIRAHAEAVRFYTDMANLNQPRWLTLLGPCGAGKTHLAKAVWSAWATIPGRAMAFQPGWKVSGSTGPRLSTGSAAVNTAWSQYWNALTWSS